MFTGDDVHQLVRAMVAGWGRRLVKISTVAAKEAGRGDTWFAK